MSDRPEVIVICGAPRSGTHLLNAVIANSKDVPPVLPETTPVTIILEAYRKTCMNNINYPNSHFKNENDITTLYGTYLRGFLDNFKEFHGSKRVVLRAPILAVYALELTKLLAAAGCSYHVLCTVRDPRDVIASFITAEQKRVASRKGNIPDLKDTEALCREWYLRYYSPVLGTAKDGSWTFVEYGRLVEAPEKETKRIAKAAVLDLTSLRAENPWTRVEADLSQRHILHGDWITPLYMSAISKTSVGKHKEVLSVEEAHIVDATAGRVYRMMAKRSNAI